MPLLIAAGPPNPSDDGQASPAGIAFFEENIRPLLENRYYKCHSAQATELHANLYLDSRPDYLASELIRSGWKLKSIHKQMMLSAAYVQSSKADSAQTLADHDNTLLWRYSPHRMEAEIIRDSMLSVSGKSIMPLRGKPIVANWR